MGFRSVWRSPAGVLVAVLAALTSVVVVAALTGNPVGLVRRHSFGLLGGHATADVVPARALFSGEVLHYAAGDPQDELTVAMPLRPADAGRSPWVLVVHGGSWLGGNPAMMAQSADLLARHGYVAFDVAYPLVGRSTDYAQQFAALSASWRWIRTHAATLGVDPDRGAVWGFSAGGQLAAMLGNRVPGVRAVVSLSGVLEPELIARIQEHEGVDEAATIPDRNLFEHMEWLVVRARWALDDRADLAAWRAFSPATYLSTRTPPTFVAQGLADPVVPPATVVLYGRQLAAVHAPHRVVLLPDVSHDERGDVIGAGADGVAWLDRFDSVSRASGSPA